MSYFEEELGKAVRDRALAADAAAEGSAAGEDVFRKNADARVEAEKRLKRLGGYARDFLVKNDIRPVQVLAGVESRFRQPRLVSVCSGWRLSRNFLTADGELVTFALAKQTYGDDLLKYRTKPGQLYAGRFDDPASAIRAYVPGVGRAMFVDSSRLPAFRSVAEFNRFYYGHLYRPPADLPTVHAALFLPPDESMLYLACLDPVDRYYGVTAIHAQLQADVLTLLDQR